MSVWFYYFIDNIYAYSYVIVSFNIDNYYYCDDCNC